MASKKRVVIIGGGFGGLQLARRLNKSQFDVLLADSQNHHQFQPLFYQVASARLEPATISFPFRKIFQRSSNLKFLLARAQVINPDNNEIETSAGSYVYDFLVIATGCKTNYFGREDIMKNALPMKTTMDAIEIRNRILLGFERLFAAGEGNTEELLNIVIVGAGPTGVELAGAFAEMKRHILPRDYPGFDFSALKIILLEGSANTLNNMSEKAKKASIHVTATDPVHLPALMKEAGLAPTTSEARRLIDAGAVRIDGQQLDLAAGEYDLAWSAVAGRVLQAGKRRYARVVG